MDDVWQPDHVIDELIEDLRADHMTWTLMLARWQESNEFVKIGKKFGKRYDLQPEYFPPASRPSITELTASFLERKFGKRYSLLNSQLALSASKFSGIE